MQNVVMQKFIEFHICCSDTNGMLTGFTIWTTDAVGDGNYEMLYSGERAAGAPGRRRGVRDEGRQEDSGQVGTASP